MDSLLLSILHSFLLICARRTLTLELEGLRHVELEGLRHVEIEQILLVHHVSSQVETNVHAGLDFNTQADSEIRQDAFYLSRCGSHESAASPSHISYVAQHLFDPCAFVCIYHLAVFSHHYMRGLVAELSHVIAAKVERGSAQYIFRQRNVSECVFALYGPGENFPFSDRFVSRR